MVSLDSIHTHSQSTFSRVENVLLESYLSSPVLWMGWNGAINLLKEAKGSGKDMSLECIMSGH